MAFLPPPVPLNESERLDELRDLDVLDTDAEDVFDGLTKLASSICGTPMALVSLVDAERQWFKSRVGLAAAETPREFAFCAHAINEPTRMFVVPDAQQDVRFQENPLVTGDPNIRFYAGMPIETRPGSAIGTLCVLDQVPRELTENQRQALQTIAKAVGSQLKLRRELSVAQTLDAVTGLPNSIAFEKRFRSITRQVSKGVLMLIGMHRLYRVAPAIGSEATDSIFRQAAQRLQAAIPAEATLAFFKRGLFVLFIADVGARELSDGVTKKLTENLIAPYGFRTSRGEQQVGCPSHIGISFFPDNGTTLDVLLTTAEQALHSAQNLDEPCRVYDKRTDEIAGKQVFLEADLRKALERGEFVNYYQPKIDLATGNITGAEALIRWMHPERGMVSPVEFIPALESSGLILAAGRDVILRAIADWRIWCEKGLVAPRIAVNVTAAQLKSSGFVSDVRTALMKVENEPALLSMEVTESTLMIDAKRASQILTELRSAGIPMAIDDFGTGYSSLAYLVTLPIDELKVDRAFVSKMTTDPAHMALVNTIISLAHGLKLKVVAEGVETDEQANLLRLLRCDQAQGFLYSRPVPAEKFAALLASRGGDLGPRV